MTILLPCAGRTDLSALYVNQESRRTQQPLLADPVPYQKIVGGKSTQEEICAEDFIELPDVPF